MRRNISDNHDDYDYVFVREILFLFMCFGMYYLCINPNINAQQISSFNCLT